LETRTHGTDGQRCAFDKIMDTHLTTLERAFQLAKSGGCKTIEELKRALRTEGHSTTHIIGRSLTKQLRELMKRPPDKSA
jgi:hypothetical protein